MSNVLVSFAGSPHVAGQFVHTPGILPSQGTVVGRREVSEAILSGDVVLGDGIGGQITVPRALSIGTRDHKTGYEPAAGDPPVESLGTVAHQFVDPRVEWQYGGILGARNVLRDDGKTYEPSTVKPDGTPYTWQELVQQCLAKMQDEDGNPSSERFIETTAYTQVTWLPQDLHWPPGTLASQALAQDLLRPIAYFVAWQLDGSVEIHQPGVGADPPEGSIRRQPIQRSNAVVQRPTSIRLVGGRNQREASVPGWFRVLVHDGLNASGTAAATSGAAEGDVLPYTSVLADWGYPHDAAGWKGGVLMKKQFGNYSSDGGTAAIAVSRKRRRLMAQWANRFQMPSADWPKRPMLSRLLRAGAKGQAAQPFAVCEHWRAVQSGGGGFENIATPEQVPIKIIDAQRGVVELLADEPIGLLTMTDVVTLDEITATLEDGEVVVVFAYQDNTDSEDQYADHFTLVRGDPNAEEADELLVRPDREMVVSRPDMVARYLEGDQNQADNEFELRVNGSAVIAKLFEAPLQQDAYEVAYNGIVPIRLNGRIRRVTYQVGRNGMPTTTAQVNSDRPESAFSPTWRELEDDMLSKRAAGESLTKLAEKVWRHVQDQHLRSKAVHVENGEGGAPARIPRVNVLSWWEALIPIVDDTAADGRARLAQIARVAGTAGSERLELTNHGPVARAHFVTSQTASHAPKGEWVVPGYYYGRVASKSGAGSAATYDIIPGDQGGTTTGKGTLVSTASPRMLGIHRALFGAYNSLVSTVNALIDVHSTGASLPGALGALTTGHLEMDVGDLTIVVYDHAGDPIALHDTDMMWPP